MSLTTRAIALCLAVFIGSAANPRIVSADSPDAGDPFTRMAQGLNPANWTMPKFNMPSLPSFKAMLPGQEEKQQIIKKKDGLVDEVSKTASDSWGKTKDALNPMKLAAWKPFGGDSPPPTSAEKSPGFFSSMFGAPEPEGKPTTANDFLKQSRPTP